MRGGQATREKILREALRLFQERGLAETSISDIEAAAGVSKGALYFHFPSKEALALAALDKAREDFKRFLREAFAQEPPRAALRRFLEKIYEKLSQEGFHTGCLFGNTAIEVANRPGPIRDFIEETFEEWKTSLAGVLREAQARGCLCREHSPEDLALFLIAALEGAILLCRLKKEGGPLRKVMTLLEALMPFEKGGEKI
ncbi:TetR family transcriptional regulator [Thermosulfurimonas marina]|uniref:TetR family transcriptional regulator n=1 Tax=Thermosulfurimonas marina TaxID=2047767 RepID=A0A6H1WRS0_9BACT|nr:TetR/AcrR family transcriptional regulator [Thermosulfurimonas marina]QJA05917.1 TetR family transcriptional regulator [Thermosulfurimonas marina]